MTTTDERPGAGPVIEFTRPGPGLPVWTPPGGSSEPPAERPQTARSWPFSASGPERGGLVLPAPENAAQHAAAGPAAPTAERWPAPTPPAPRRRAWRDVATVAALAAVTVVAVYGQYGFFADRLAATTHPLPVPPAAAGLIVAITIEVVGLFLQAEAHAALLAGDPALRLRLAAYGVAGGVGVINYDHWSTAWAPNTAAVTFGTLSAIAPWLWAVRSRSTHRAELRAAGLIEPRAVRFGLARWTLHFRRTWRLTRLAVWDGITDPLEALATYDLPVPWPPADPEPAPEPEPEPAGEPENNHGHHHSNGSAAPIQPAGARGPAVAKDAAVRDVAAMLRAGHDVTLARLMAAPGYGGRTWCADVLREARALIADGSA